MKLNKLFFLQFLLLFVPVLSINNNSNDNSITNSKIVISLFDSKENCIENTNILKIVNKNVSSSCCCNSNSLKTTINYNNSNFTLIKKNEECSKYKQLYYRYNLNFKYNCDIQISILILCMIFSITVFVCLLNLIYDTNILGLIKIKGLKKNHINYNSINC
mgnify:CR=1 FL=1